jgi:hypothetical protein
MNSLIIILGIVIIFFIYLLFQYLTNTATTVAPSADLTTSLPSVTGNKLASATNLSYGYGIWLYVQNWDNNVQKTIFYRADNIKVYLDRMNPTLYCDITLNDSTSVKPSIKKIEITNSFPLQKWVYIIVSVDNQFVDCYLDGKLVKSQKVLTPKQPLDAATAPLYLGNTGEYVTTGTPFKQGEPGVSVGSGWSANVLLFTRWTKPVDPQTAWSWYMKGNGKSRYGSLFGSYGVNYSILKDNISIVNNQPLF